MPLEIGQVVLLWSALLAILLVQIAATVLAVVLVWPSVRTAAVRLADFLFSDD
jgi:hypothetical protein